MTLTEAIEIQEQHQKGTDPLYLPRLPEAEKLLIEAAKRENRFRLKYPLYKEKLLPGETEE